MSATFCTAAMIVFWELLLLCLAQGLLLLAVYSASVAFRDSFQGICFQFGHVMSEMNWERYRNLELIESTVFGVNRPGNWTFAELCLCLPSSQRSGAERGVESRERGRPRFRCGSGA